MSSIQKFNTPSRHPKNFLTSSEQKIIIRSASSRELSKRSPSPNSELPPSRGLNYRQPHHSSLPHVVKFSGGRSSAAMVMRLAEGGYLKPERGDVILFANTSAEHPGTYDFTIKCTELLEQKFNLPVFWYEFCTVEDAVGGVYKRKRTYRLVKPIPFERDPRGYRSKGEVFEEMLSFQSMLPNPHSRSCTAKLKLHPGHALLAEWFSQADGPAHEGHHKGEAYLNLQAAAEIYRRNGGTASAKDYIKAKQYLQSLPTARPKQLWQDFTTAKLRADRQVAPPLRRLSDLEHDLGFAQQASLFGPTAVQFITLLGLRDDERRRINRVLMRTVFAEGAGSSKCQVSNQPPGEQPYFPLADDNLTSKEIQDYWASQDFGLNIPEWAGNCVYCFMKGTESLRGSAHSPDALRASNTPSDITWWSDIERRYRREAPARNGNGISKFGFLGVSGPSYAQIAANNAPRKTRFSQGTPACDCTD